MSVGRGMLRGFLRLCLDWSVIRQNSSLAISMSEQESNSVNGTRVLNVAIAGNPNTGKSSLFNRLTGLRQRVGNYPGITVEKKSGSASFGGRELNIVDLPGTYSLCAASPDEAVVVEYLLGYVKGEHRPDLVVCVVDSTSLLRSLFMAAQMADLGLPMVLALNMWDEARATGRALDVALLSERLGVPCIPTSAKTGEGIEELKQAIVAAAQEGRAMRSPNWPEAVHKASVLLREGLGDLAGTYSDAVIRRVLFDSSGALADGLGIDAQQRQKALAGARKVLFDAGYNPMACEAMIHYRDLREWTVGICPEGCGEAGREMLHSGPGMGQGRGFRRWRGGRGAHGGGHSESIDRLLLHRGWGLVVFIGVMYLVFQAVYSWAGPFMEAIEWAVGSVQSLASSALVGSPMLQSLISDGVIGGIGACLVFLPQIMILFMFVAVLEDSGYLPRAAFLMDKMFSWCGLSGKSFVPMLSSYACAVPGIMAARTIKDPKARIATIMVSPLMSCSARLPVYVLFIGIFIQPRYGSFFAGLLLFAMHMLGLIISGPVAFVLTRWILRSKPQPFLLELPPYRVPSMKDVALRMYERGKVFVRTAGTVIFAMSIIIWALLYFPHPAELEDKVGGEFIQAVATEQGLDPAEAESLVLEDEDMLAQMGQAVESAYIEQSYLGRFGRFVQPLFAPAGFDWKLSVGIVSSFPAREVILSTLGVIYRLGEDVESHEEALRERMMSETWESGPRMGQPVYTLPTVLALMVFFALCQQCMATLAAIVREAGWGWAVYSFVYMTVLAWVTAVAVYQIGSAI